MFLSGRNSTQTPPNTRRTPDLIDFHRPKAAHSVRQNILFTGLNVWVWDCFPCVMSDLLTWFRPWFSMPLLSLLFHYIYSSCTFLCFYYNYSCGFAYELILQRQTAGQGKDSEVFVEVFRKAVFWIYKCLKWCEAFMEDWASVETLLCTFHQQPFWK